MSSRGGFGDDNHSDGDTSPSPERSPFSTAFNTPCLASIITNGIREVPASASEHPEDLYDALEVEFQQAMLYNLERKHETQITWEERGFLVQHLTMSEDTWKALPKAEKGILGRNQRHKAPTYFGMKGTPLIRKPEAITADTEHETNLPLR
jgi:hypothetical protein